MITVRPTGVIFSLFMIAGCQSPSVASASGTMQTTVNPAAYQGVPQVGATVGQGDGFAAAINALAQTPGSGVRAVGTPIAPTGMATPPRSRQPTSQVSAPIPQPSPQAEPAIVEPEPERIRIRRF